jgi:hypothetical protein
MTTTALKVYPKVYWIWNHRRWCLEHIPECPDPADTQTWRRSIWERELFIVERMLDADSRNCPSVPTCRMFIHDSQLSVRSSYGVGLSPLCPREHAHSSSRKGGVRVHNEKDCSQLLEL